jgi:hypothetical protein
MANQNENKVVIGIRAWGTSPQKKRGFNDDNLPRLEFLKLQPGLNHLRIVSSVGVYCAARWKGPESKKPFGDWVRSAYPTYDDCPLKNDLGVEPKERNMVVAIDRRNNDLRLFDMSPLVVEQIDTNLEVKNSRRAEGNKVSPKDFDISIKFDPKAKKPTGFYSVVADDCIPMSEDDLKLIKETGGDDVIEQILAKQLICPKRETVIKRLQKLGWDGKPVEKTEDSKSKEILETPQEDDYRFTRPAEAESEGEVANG